MASIFSLIAQGEIPSYKCAETDEFYVFLDINPLVKILILHQSPFSNSHKCMRDKTNGTMPLQHTNKLKTITMLNT